MPLQDLTPQLRTRLSRVERAVGFFVTAATILLVLGFAYYVYHTAKRKGWFLTKIVYSTSLNNAAGLKPGDAVKLMGFNVGELVSVVPNEPDAWYGVTVYFTILEPNYGYIWTDSKARIAAADFLGNRSLEILKGRAGIPTVLIKDNKASGVLDSKAVKATEQQMFKVEFDKAFEKARAEFPAYPEHALRAEATNAVEQALPYLLKERVTSAPDLFYRALAKTNSYWIEPLESPALTERLETVVDALQTALPNVLQMTNQISTVLSNAETSTTQLSALLAEARPMVTNLTLITGNLTNANGSLGDWLLPTNLAAQLTLTLDSAKTTLDTADKTLNTANGTLASTDTNLTLLVSNLNVSLINLGNLTSNLNMQVQTNSNIVKEVSDAIVHTDDLVQGLKRHWLLRSAFKTNKVDKAKAPSSSRSSKPIASPRATK